MLKLKFQPRVMGFLKERRFYGLNLVTVVPSWRATVHFNKEVYLIGLNPTFPQISIQKPRLKWNTF